MVAGMVGEHDSLQPTAFGKSGRYGKHDAVAERYDGRLHVGVGIMPFRYAVGSFEQRTPEVAGHEVEVYHQVFDAERGAVAARAFNLACIVV